MAKKAKAQTDDLLKSKVKHSLVFKLDDASLAEKGKAMAALDEEIVGLESEFDKVKAEWKAKISAKEKDRRHISEIVRAGEERRLVECVEERDYAANAVRYYYEGELKEERVMSAEERQTDLALRDSKETTQAAPTKKRRFPGNGKNPADFKKAAAGDADDEKDDLTHVIRAETNGKTKRSAVDGPVKDNVQ